MCEKEVIKKKFDYWPTLERGKYEECVKERDGRKE